MAKLLEPTLCSLLKARALSKDDLNIVCSEEHCNELALKITRWKLICPFIGLEEEDQDEIDEDYRRSKEKKIG